MPPKQSTKPAKNKQKPQTEEREEFLQAVVLADSFETRFRPFTIDQPRCLLPLANTPLIEYTLEFLASAGVHDVFLYTGAHADQVEEYINSSRWKRPSSPFQSFNIFKSSATSIGDCMRDLDNRDLITGDFVFVTGDVISNLNLEPVLNRHRARREKDKNAVMTMVLREAGRNHRLKGTSRRPVFVIAPEADRCLHYEEIGRRKGGSHYVSLDPDLIKEHGEIEVRDDLIDCHIDICTPDVLAQWSDNFDYQTLRNSFLFGVLKDYELNGKTIHTHILADSYATRVKNIRTYGAVTQDIMERWTYPFSPDSNFLPEQEYKLAAGKNYLDKNVKLHRTCTLKGRNVIGAKSIVAQGTTLTNCTLGPNCRIGSNVQIVNAYLWDNVTVGDNTSINHSIIGNNAIIGSSCTLEPGSLISNDVHVPENTTVKGDALTKRQEPQSPSSTPANQPPTYQSSSSDSEPEDSTLAPHPHLHPSHSSSASSISTLTSQLSTSPLASPLSRRSSTFSDPSDAFQARQNRDFHLEATSSILDGLTEGHAPDTIFLELNGYRMSVDAPPHAVLASVVAAFMKRITNLIDDDDGNTSPREAVSSVFTKYKTLADRIILDKTFAQKTDQVDFLLCVQRECVGRERGGELLLFVAKEVYDLEVVEEDGVMQWWGDERSGKGEMGGVRGLTEQFVTFLREAEEDDDEDDDEEEEEEEAESEGDESE